MFPKCEVALNFFDVFFILYFVLFTGVEIGVGQAKQVKYTDDDFGKLKLSRRRNNSLYLHKKRTNEDIVKHCISLNTLT
jgi:hypothetical protein